MTRLTKDEAWQAMLRRAREMALIPKRQPKGKSTKRTQPGIMGTGRRAAIYRGWLNGQGTIAQAPANWATRTVDGTKPTKRRPITDSVGR